MKNEVRPIDANALAKRIREHMDNFPYAGTRLATCRVVLSMLGDEGQTPTLKDHFPEVRKMMPIALDQLKAMNEKVVFVQIVKKDFSSVCDLKSQHGIVKPSEGRIKLFNGMQTENLPNDMSRSWGMRRIILLSRNDLDALSTALRRMQPLTMERTLDGVELTAEVRPAHPAWGVAMVIQVRAKEGCIEWVQAFDSIQAFERCYGSFTDRIQRRLGCFRGAPVRE